MSNKKLPLYRCHKVVRAARIESIKAFNEDGDAELFLEGGLESSVSGAWMARVVPAEGRDALIGGYFIQYEDGYASWSPSKAFEEGYAPLADKSETTSIEREIQTKGLTAPRVTPGDIEANIVSEHYFTGAEGVLGAYRTNGDVYVGTTPNVINAAALPLLTFCVLVLKNGFTVTGESACASPENFDTRLGRKIARQNAVSKIWPLMGYELRSKLVAKG